MVLKLICSDCDGVLSNVGGDYSKSGWYQTISNDSLELYNQIHRFFFKNSITDGRRYLCYSWMSGEITYRDVNRIIANNFEIDFDYLNEKLIESAKNLELNWELIDIYQKYRKDGLKVCITTDNMDIFSLYTVPANNLNNYFDGIYNSSDLGHLKGDNELKIFRKMADDNGLKLSEVMIVDDNKKLIEKAKEIGFSTYLYNQDTYIDFENVLCKML